MGSGEMTSPWGGSRGLERRGYAGSLGGGVLVSQGAEVKKGEGAKPGGPA